MKGSNKGRPKQWLTSSLHSLDSIDEATYETASHELDSRAINLIEAKGLRPKLLWTAGLKSDVVTPELRRDSFSHEESKRATRNTQL